MPTFGGFASAGAEGNFTGPTVTGSDTIGFVAIHAGGGGTVSAVTWGGVSMTRLTPSEDRSLHVFVVDNPSSAATIAITESLVAQWISMASYWTGADVVAQSAVGSSTGGTEATATLGSNTTSGDTLALFASYFGGGAQGRLFTNWEVNGSTTGVTQRYSEGEGGAGDDVLAGMASDDDGATGSTDSMSVTPDGLTLPLQVLVVEISAAATNVTGSGSPTEANDTSAGSGEFTPPDITGSGTPSEANDTSTGSGTFVGPTVTGSGTPTEQADTSAGTGEFTAPQFTGAGTPSEVDDTGAGTGEFTAPSFTGSGTPTETNDTSAGSGSFVTNPTGSGSPVEANDTSAGVGSFTDTGECSIPAVTQFPAPYARTSWGFFGPGFLQIFTCVAGGTTINTEGARLRTRAGTTTVDTGGTTINTEGARLRLRAGETTITLGSVTVDTTGGHLQLRAGETQVLTGSVIDTTGGRLRLRAGTTTVISGRQFIPDVACQVDHAGVACSVDSVGVGCTTTALTVECEVET